jgi:hypothetical protein
MVLAAAPRMQSAVEKLVLSSPKCSATRSEKNSDASTARASTDHSLQSRRVEQRLSARGMLALAHGQRSVMRGQRNAERGSALARTNTAVNPHRAFVALDDRFGDS